MNLTNAIIILVLSTCALKCDFENGLCNWAFPFSANSYALQWTRFKGSSPSSMTGPSRDHTNIAITRLSGKHAFR